MGARVSARLPSEKVRREAHGPVGNPSLKAGKSPGHQVPSGASGQCSRGSPLAVPTGLALQRHSTPGIGEQVRNTRPTLQPSQPACFPGSPGAKRTSAQTLEAQPWVHSGPPRALLEDELSTRPGASGPVVPAWLGRPPLRSPTTGQQTGGNRGPALAPLASLTPGKEGGLSPQRSRVRRQGAGTLRCPSLAVSEREVEPPSRQRPHSTVHTRGANLRAEVGAARPYLRSPARGDEGSADPHPAPGSNLVPAGPDRHPESWETPPCALITCRAPPASPAPPSAHTANHTTLPTK